MSVSRKFFLLTVLGILTVIAIVCYAGNRQTADEHDVLFVTESIVTDMADELESPREDLALPGKTQTSISHTQSVAKNSSRLVQKYRHWSVSSAFSAKDIRYSLIPYSCCKANVSLYAISTVSQRLSLLCRFII